MSRSGKVWRNQPNWQDDRDADSRDADNQGNQAHRGQQGPRGNKRADYNYDYDYDEQYDHQWNREGANVGNPKVYSDSQQYTPYNRRDQYQGGGGGGNQYNRQNRGHGRQQQHHHHQQQQQYESRQSYRDRDSYGDQNQYRESPREPYRERQPYRDRSSGHSEPQRARKVIKRRPPAQPYRPQSQRFPNKPRKPVQNRRPAQSKAKKKQRHIQIVSLPRAMAKLQFGSRKVSVDYVRNSRVAVNNNIVSDPNQRIVLFKDRITVDFMPLKANRKSNYIVLNKTRGLTPSKEAGERSVHSLIPNSEKWYFPSGRLTKAATGLVIMTNDPEHRNYMETQFNGLEKEYRIKVHRLAKRTDLSAITKALRELHESHSKETKSAVWQKNKSSCWISIIVKQAKLTEIFSILKKVGLEVLAVHRHRIGGLVADNVQPGVWMQMNEIQLAEMFGNDTNEASYFYQKPPKEEAAADELAEREEDAEVDQLEGEFEEQEEIDE